MSYRLAQPNFSKGELGPELAARFDVEAYQTAVRKARNVYIRKYGGLCKRPGTRYVAEVYNASDHVRVIPFQFSLTQTYALELGDEYLRVINGGGLVTNAAKAITGISSATYAAISCASHGYSAGDQVYFSGVGGALADYVNGRIKTVMSVVDSGHFTIDLNSAALPAYTSGGTVARIVRASSPYAGGDVFDVDFEQSADTLYLAHISYPPQKLVRSAHDSWAFSDMTFGPVIEPPTGMDIEPNVINTTGYFPLTCRYVVTSVNEDGRESRMSDVVSAVNDLTLKQNYNRVMWDSLTGAVKYNVYKSEESQFYGFIGSTDGISFVDINIAPALDKAPPELFNPFDAAGNYPSTVTFFEQRLFFARTSNSPNAIWASRSADHENMDRSSPLRDDDSLSFAIVSGRVNAVNQLVSTTSLIALTSDSIFKIDGDPNGGYLTATQTAARRQIGRGCSRLPPLVADNAIFYTPSAGSSVRSINYSFEIDGLKSDDLTIFSPHMFEGFSIVSWCYAQEPNSIVWAARSDGKLLCFTWEQAQQVWGWTLCETDGEVLSVCSVTEDGEDRVYLVVRRDIAGQSRTFLERMASHYWSDVRDCCFLDCAISFSYDTPRREFAGLWHLEGQEVTGFVDGFTVGGLTVANGKVVLPDTIDPVSKATFGLMYDVDIQTNPVVFDSRDAGSNAGRRQQVGEMVVHLRNSRGVKIGSGKPDANEPLTYEIKPRRSEAWGTADALLDGKYQVGANNVVAGEASVYIKQSDPFPLTLLGVYLDPITGG